MHNKLSSDWLISSYFFLGTYSIFMVQWVGSLLKMVHPMLSLLILGCTVFSQIYIVLLCVLVDIHPNDSIAVLMSTILGIVNVMIPYHYYIVYMRTIDIYSQQNNVVVL